MVSVILVAGCDANRSVEPSATADDIAAVRIAGGSELAAPSNAVAVAASESEVDVTWQDNSGNETRFEIFRSTGGASLTLLATMPAGNARYSDRGLAAATAYCYAIRAVRVTGVKTTNSASSNTACASTMNSPIVSPSNADAVGLSTSRISLTWTDNSTGETRFEVYRSGGPFVADFSLLTTLGANATTYSDEGLTPGVQYCYKVRAVQLTQFGLVASPMSAVDCAWTIPLAAHISAAAPWNSDIVAVAWEAVGFRFRIEKSTNGGALWTTAGTAEYTRNFFDNVVTEQAVCYRVINYNESGDGAASNTQCTAAPAAPSLVSEAIIDGSPSTLTWADNSAVEDGYEVRDWYPDCFRDWDGQEYCYGYYEVVVAVLPANTTSYRPSTGGGRASVYAMKDGGYSSGGFLPPQ